MLTNRFLRSLDYTLIGSTLILLAVSLVMISSATHVNTMGEDRYWYLQRQGLFALLNILVLIVSLNWDYQQLARMAKGMYVVNLLLLLGVMLVGHSALGAQRWIQIGPVSLQPSEFSKLIMIISLAQLLEERKDKLQTWSDLLPVFLYVGVPFLLVLKQPDLGTSLVFLAILFGMLYVAGIKRKLLFSIFGAGIAIMPIFWHFLKDYQKKRLTVFIDPGADPLGSGYHIIQSKIAIGSGMLTGKGLFEGTQSQLKFLPENHTDFIFAVIGEELGFIGCVLILSVFFVLIYRGLQIAMSARDDFGCLLAAGIVSMLTFHVLVNVGMTAGIMPVTGIPLPFISYGVSSLTTNMLSVALLLNIYMRRQKLFF